MEEIMKNDDDYFDSTEFHDLLSEYEQAVASNSPVFLDADELTDIADYYQMNGQDDAAERAIRLALSLSPGAIGPLSYRIHSALYRDDIEQAKQFYGQIVETDEPDYVYLNAEIMLAENRAEEAHQFLLKQYELIDNDERQDYMIDVASIFSDYGQDELAMKWMKMAKPEDSPDFKELMARTLFGLGKYKDSERLFNELIDTNPFSKHYWNALASAQFMNEDYANAIQSSEFAIAIDPNDADGLLSKANGLYNLGNYEEAQKYYQRYSEQEPDDELAMVHQAACLINMGMNDEALQLLHHALEQADADSPYLGDIYQELAFALSETGQIDDALDTLDKTLSLDCDHVQMDIIRGHILLANDRPIEAEKCFQKAIRTSETPAQTLLRIIVSVYDNSYFESAYNMFHKYFEMAGDDCTDGHAYMALCCYEMKKYDEFLDHLLKATRLNPQECSLVLRHLFPEEIAPKDYYDYIKEKLK